LTPELAWNVSQARNVIFVDASVANPGSPIVAQPLDASEAGEWEAHRCEPRTIVSLSATLYDHAPNAWLVAVPGADFDFGEALSLQGAKGMSEALKVIADLIGQKVDYARSGTDAAGDGDCAGSCPTNGRN
jgi:Ni,Fe-hydrogenase maturation factor